MWMMLLHLHVNQKFDNADYDPCYAEYVFTMCITVLPNFYPINLIKYSSCTCFISCKHVFSIRVGIG